MPLSGCFYELIIVYLPSFIFRTSLHLTHNTHYANIQHLGGSIDGGTRDLHSSGQLVEVDSLNGESDGEDRLSGVENIEEDEARSIDGMEVLGFSERNILISIMCKCYVCIINLRLIRTSRIHDFIRICVNCVRNCYQFNGIRI